MSKYKILVIPSDKCGCGKFRSIDPHVCLQEMYGDIFEIDYRYHDELFAERDRFPEFLSKYDLIHIHKQVDDNGVFIQMCKYLGKKIIVDVDDHYDLGNSHPMALTARLERWGDRVIRHIMYADYVTTTQNVFKQTLLKHNKNVFVLPNAINPNEEQFKPKKIESDKLRVGIICGSSHLEDIKLLNGMISQFTQDELDRLQFVLCGFDINGSVTRYRENGEKYIEPIKPLETCWYKYERILTNDYKIVSEDCKNFLHLFVPNSEYPKWEEEHYRRCWTKHISEYATHYNNIDVLLVPLVNNPFNLAKSNLKVIEAGFFHKAIIASNVGPYKEDLISAVDKGDINYNGNSLLVDENKNNRNWSKYIKLLLNDKKLLTSLQENLYNTVKDKYDLRTITEIRKDFYLKILEEK